MGLKANKTDLKDLKTAFNQMNTNQDGTLSESEVSKAGQKLE